MNDAREEERTVTLRMEGSEMLLDALAAHEATLQMLRTVIRERDALREKYEGKKP